MANEEFGVIPQEQLDRIRYSFSQLAESISNAWREIVDKLAPVIPDIVRVLAEQIAKPSDEILRLYATSKEWHIYKHTKKAPDQKEIRRPLRSALDGAIIRREPRWPRSDHQGGRSWP